MEYQDEPSMRRDFLKALNARLSAGAVEYGDKSFDKPLAMSAAEIEDEVLDIAGWAYVAFGQIRRRMARIRAADAKASTAFSAALTEIEGEASEARIAGRLTRAFALGHAARILNAKMIDTGLDNAGQ